MTQPTQKPELQRLHWLQSALKDIGATIAQIYRDEPQAGFEVWQEYLYQQKECLSKFDDIRDSLTRQIGGRQGLCVFLFGSIARLEYVPGISDADILPIRDKLNSNELEQEAEAFLEMQSKVRTSVEESFGEMNSSINGRTTSSINIDMHSVKLGDKRYFVSMQDLIQSMGTDLERFWSSGERFSLLEESVYLAGDRKFAVELRKNILDVYSCLPDFKAGRFPKLIYIFAQEVLAQGLGNAIREMRQKMEREEANQSDRELVKLLFARFVGVKVKKLAWHLLFWIRQRDSSFTKKSREFLDSLLNQPPIYWGLYGLDDLAHELGFSDPQPPFEEWLEYQLTNTDCSERQINKLKEAFDGVMDSVRFPKTTRRNRKSTRDNNFSIGELMLDLWSSCWQVRTGENQELKEIKRLNREVAKLVQLTGEAARITQWLEKIRLDKLEEPDRFHHYERCWHLIQPALFPESKPIWEE